MLSKKKILEFNNIFKLYGQNEFVIDINLVRKIFESDFFQSFLTHINNLILDIIEKEKTVILHINVESFEISDLIYYDKIYEMTKTINNHTNKITNTYIYGCSVLTSQIITMLSNSLEHNKGGEILFLPISDFVFNDFILNNNNNNNL